MSFMLAYIFRNTKKNNINRSDESNPTNTTTSKDKENDDMTTATTKYRDISNSNSSNSTTTNNSINSILLNNNKAEKTNKLEKSSSSSSKLLPSYSKKKKISFPLMYDTKNIDENDKENEPQKKPHSLLQKKENKHNSSALSCGSSSSNYTFMTANTSFKSNIINNNSSLSATMKKSRLLRQSSNRSVNSSRISKQKSKSKNDARKKEHVEVPSTPPPVRRLKKNLSTSMSVSSTSSEKTPEGLRPRLSIEELKSRYNLVHNKKDAVIVDKVVELPEVLIDSSPEVTNINEDYLGKIDIVASSPKLTLGGALTAVGALLAQTEREGKSNNRLLGLSPIPLRSFDDYADEDDDNSSNHSSKHDNSFSTTWREYQNQYEGMDEEAVNSSFSSRQGLFLQDQEGRHGDSCMGYDFNPIIEIEHNYNNKHEYLQDNNIENEAATNTSYVSGITSCNTFDQSSDIISTPGYSNNNPTNISSHSNSNKVMISYSDSDYSSNSPLLKKKEQCNNQQIKTDTKSKEVILIKFIQMLQLNPHLISQEEDTYDNNIGNILNGYTIKDRQILLDWYSNISHSCDLMKDDYQESCSMLHAIQFMSSIIKPSTTTISHQQQRSNQDSIRELVLASSDSDMFTSPSSTSTNSSFTPITDNNNIQIHTLQNPIHIHPLHNHDNKQLELSTLNQTDTFSTFTSPSSSTSTPTTSNLSTTSFSFHATPTTTKDDNKMNDQQNLQKIISILKVFSIINSTVLSMDDAASATNEEYLLNNVLSELRESYSELLKMKRHTVRKLQDMLLQKQQQQVNNIDTPDRNSILSDISNVMTRTGKLKRIYELEENIIPSSSTSLVPQQKGLDNTKTKATTTMFKKLPKKKPQDVIALLKQQKLSIHGSSTITKCKSITTKPMLGLLNNLSTSRRLSKGQQLEQRDGVDNTSTQDLQLVSTLTTTSNYRIQGFNHLRSQITDIKRKVNWKPITTNNVQHLQQVDSNEDEEVNNICQEYFLLNDDNDMEDEDNNDTTTAIINEDESTTVTPISHSQQQKSSNITTISEDECYSINEISKINNTNNNSSTTNKDSDENNQLTENKTKSSKINNNETSKIITITNITHENRKAIVAVSDDDDTNKGINVEYTNDDQGQQQDQENNEDISVDSILSSGMIFAL